MQIVRSFGFLFTLAFALSVRLAPGSEILISGAWMQENPRSGKQEVSLYVEGLSASDSFDIEVASDLAPNFWHPIYRHTYSLGYGYGSSYGYGYGSSYGYGYGYGYGGVVESRSYGYGYGFAHALSFGYGYGGSFSWTSDYFQRTGSKTFYRVRNRTAMP